MGREISTFPSDDAAFAEYVRLRAEGATTPEELAAACRDWYPAIRVSTQEALATVVPESEPTWYAYREATAFERHGEPWWTSGNVARIEFDQDGIVGAANDSAAALVGGELDHQTLSDLRSSGWSGDPSWLWGAIERHGAVLSIARLRRLDGSELDAQFRAEHDSRRGRYVTYWRPLVIVGSGDSS
jgi:hypothetical protein